MSLRTQALLFALWLTSSCRPADVVAQVGDRRITQGDVRASAKLQSIDKPEAALDGLVEQELFAAAATERGLEKTPAVQARLRAAEREILAQALIDAELPPPDDKTLQEAWERTKTLEVRQLELAHIFISSPPDSSAEAKSMAQSRANAAWARLLGGEDFAEVARTASEDTATSARGGGLGLVREGQIAQNVFDAAVALQPGAASKPVQTPFGFHILKAVSAVTTHKPALAEVRGKLEKQLRDTKLTELRGRLSASISVKRFEAPLAELQKERR